MSGWPDGTTWQGPRVVLFRASCGCEIVNGEEERVRPCAEHAHDPLCDAKDCTHGPPYGPPTWCEHYCMCDQLNQARNEAYALGRDDEADGLPLRHWGARHADDAG